MPLEIHAQAKQVNFSPLITVGMVLLAFVYCHGWLRIQGALPTLLPFWRLAGFVSGLFSLWIALGSPLAALDHQLLTVHMMRHLLLMTAGAPLVLLGAPSLPLQCGLPNYLMGRGLLFGSRMPPFLGCFLNNSAFCWLAGSATLIAWHIPILFDLAISSHTWHIVEDTSFLSACLLLSRPTPPSCSSNPN